MSRDAVKEDRPLGSAYLVQSVFATKAILEQSWVEHLKELHILRHPAASIPDSLALPLVFKAHVRMASPVSDLNMTGWNSFPRWSVIIASS